MKRKRLLTYFAWLGSMVALAGAPAGADCPCEVYRPLLVHSDFAEQVKASVGPLVIPNGGLDLLDCSKTAAIPSRCYRELTGKEPGVCLKWNARGSASVSPHELPIIHLSEEKSTIALYLQAIGEYRRCAPLSGVIPDCAQLTYEQRMDYLSRGLQSQDPDVLKFFRLRGMGEEDLAALQAFDLRTRQSDAASLEKFEREVVPKLSLRVAMKMVLLMTSIAARYNYGEVKLPNEAATDSASINRAQRISLADQNDPKGKAGVCADIFPAAVLALRYHPEVKDVGTIGYAAGKAGHAAGLVFGTQKGHVYHLNWTTIEERVGVDGLAAVAPTRLMGDTSQGTYWIQNAQGRTVTSVVPNSVRFSDRLTGMNTQILDPLNKGFQGSVLDGQAQLGRFSLNASSGRSSLDGSVLLGVGTGLQLGDPVQGGFQPRLGLALTRVNQADESQALGSKSSTALSLGLGADYSLPMQLTEGFSLTPTVSAQVKEGVALTDSAKEPTYSTADVSSRAEVAARYEWDSGASVRVAAGATGTLGTDNVRLMSNEVTAPGTIIGYVNQYYGSSAIRIPAGESSVVSVDTVFTKNPELDARLFESLRYTSRNWTLGVTASGCLGDGTGMSIVQDHCLKNAAIDTRFRLLDGNLSLGAQGSLNEAGVAGGMVTLGN